MVDDTLPGRWIRSRLNSTIQTVTHELEAYRFDRAANALYQFFWHEYCDWYLELIKPALQDTQRPSYHEGAKARRTLGETLEVFLRLLHPFMPYITEEIWQTFRHADTVGETIVTQQYPLPQPRWCNPDAEGTFQILEQSINLIRTARALLNYPPAKIIRFFATHEDPKATANLEKIDQNLTHLGRGQLLASPDPQLPKPHILRLVTEGLTVGVVVEGDVDLQKAIERLVKQITETDKELQRVDGKLKNAEFVSKAPPDVIAEHQERVRTLSRDRALLDNSEQQLRTMLGS